MTPSKAIAGIDPEVLGDAIRRHLNGPHHPRAELLRLLVREPEITTREIAGEIGRSPSTVRHYLAILRCDGLSGLFGPSPGGRKLTFQEVETLLAEVRGGNFRSYDEIVRWVGRRFNVDYTIQGIRHLLGETSRLDRRIVIVPETTSEGSPAHDISYVAPEERSRLSTFLNMLPVASDAESWIRSMQDAFCHLFPDLASIVILLNRSASFDGKGRPNVGMSVLDFKNDSGSERESERRIVDRRKEDVVAAIVAQMRRMGKNPDHYYPPIDFLAQMVEGDWVGRILLFFPRTAADPRARVEGWLERMRPFLTFCLSDGVARSRASSPQHRPFQTAIDRLTTRYGLTRREREVTALYLDGSSIEEIADDLSIAVSTVKNHINNVRTKTSTRYQRELLKLVVNI